MRPQQDEIEVTVFGPGYGESIVIHIGSGKWAIIDSCVDRESNPLSIKYLKKMGVSVEKDVISVSASHWHDDHVKGLSKTIQACKSARFSLGSALSNSEFIAFLMDHENQIVEKLDKGGSELLACLNLMEGKTIKPLSEDTIIFDFEEEILAHKERVELRAVSPSGKQFIEFIQGINQLYQSDELLSKGRISSKNRNELSVAMILTIGKQAVLLGADLEHETDPQKGWEAVVSTYKDKVKKSHIFKIPHHGSNNAHNDKVWDKMVSQPVWSVVTPWNKGGKKLPSQKDINRLKRFAHACHITSSKKSNPSFQTDGETKKFIRKKGLEIKSSLFSYGYVRYRWCPGDKVPKVHLSGSASKL